MNSKTPKLYKGEWRPLRPENGGLQVHVTDLKRCDNCRWLSNRLRDLTTILLCVLSTSSVRPFVVLHQLYEKDYKLFGEYLSV